MDFIGDIGPTYYEGEWKDGVYHGKGTIAYPTWSYEGCWEDGEMHGHGIKKDAAGTLVVKGKWENGAYVEGSDELEDHGETEDTISEALELD